MAATSSASASDSGGSNDGRRCASIDFPVPGGPVNSSECPPAAAISSARLACACPRTSARSGDSAHVGAALTYDAGNGAAPVRCPHTASSVGAPYTAAPRTRAASSADAAGRMNAWPSRDARQRHRERAANGAQVAGQREFAREFVGGERGARNLSAGRQDAQRDRQIVAPRFLRQIGRRQVDRDLARRYFEAGILQCSTHAIARLAHFGVRKSHEMDPGQAPADVHLHRHARGGDAGERAAVQNGDGHRRLRIEVTQCGNPARNPSLRAGTAGSSVERIRHGRAAPSSRWSSPQARNLRRVPRRHFEFGVPSGALTRSGNGSAGNSRGEGGERRKRDAPQSVSLRACAGQCRPRGIFR